MAPISQNRLEIWIYKLLLGTLPKAKKELLRETLERRNREHKIFSALEQKVLAAFTAKRPTRKYLAELMDDWETRNWGN